MPMEEHRGTPIIIVNPIKYEGDIASSGDLIIESCIVNLVSSKQNNGVITKTASRKGTVRTDIPSEVDSSTTIRGDKIDIINPGKNTARLFSFTISLVLNGAAKRFAIVPLVLSLVKGAVVKRGIVTIVGISASRKRALDNVNLSADLSDKKSFIHITAVTMINAAAKILKAIPLLYSLKSLMKIALALLCFTFDMLTQPFLPQDYF